MKILCAFVKTIFLNQITTEPLWMHLLYSYCNWWFKFQSLHPEEHAEYLAYGELRKNAPVGDRKRWSCVFSQENWESNVTAFVLDAMIPLHIVETESFRKIFDGIWLLFHGIIYQFFSSVINLVRCLADLKIKKNGVIVKHLTRYTLLKRIVRAVEVQLDEIRNIVEKTKYVCTTADAWSGKKRRFLGVTLHWVSN